MVDIVWNLYGGAHRCRSRPAHAASSAQEDAASTPLSLWERLLRDEVDVEHIDM